MKQLFAILLSVAFLSSMSAHGQDKPPLVGKGIHTCKKMVANINKTATSRSEYTQWAFGFMSSLALVHSQPVFEVSTPDEIWLAVETICKKNPKQQVFEATSVVYLELLNIFSKPK